MMKLNFNADFEKYTDIEVSIRHDLTTLETFIKDKNFSFASKNNNRHSQIKLPKFELKKFNGDPINWKGFIQSFDAAIDKKQGSIEH